MRFLKMVKEAVKLGGIPLSHALGRPVVPPSVAGVHLTGRCNSRCRMCNFWKSPEGVEDELSLPEIRKALGELRELGIQFLSFAAEGEIFTRPDACEIFAEARNFGFDYSINTNGLYLPEDFVRNIHKLAPYLVVFGLDTADPKNYEEIRGIPRGLEKVLDSIRRLKAQGYHSLSIGSVVLHNNLHQLLDLCRLAQKEGVQNIRFTAFSPIGFGKTWESDELSGYYDPHYLKELKDTIGQLLEFKCQYGIISNSNCYLTEIPNYYESHFQYFPLNCIVGYYNVQIMPNGDVTICSYRRPSSIIGNVKRDSLLELWSSDKANEEWLKIKNKSCPTCWMSCFAENNMRFSIRRGIASNVTALRRSCTYKL